MVNYIWPGEMSADNTVNHIWPSEKGSSCAAERGAENETGRHSSKCATEGEVTSMREREDKRNGEKNLRKCKP